MKKYERVFIFIATSAILLTALVAYLFLANSRNTAVWNISSFLTRKQHSVENKNPYAQLHGTTVRIQPYDASFEVPQGWLNTKPAVDEHVKNLFLSLQDLDDLDAIDHEFNGQDSDEAEVISSVLSFDDCAAHVGDMGWGNGMWNDLQSRVYVTNLTADQITADLEKDGLSKATRIFTNATLSESQARGNWKNLTLSIFDFPSWSDFGLGERLDFFIRPFGDKTVVFVFLHSDGFSNEIDLLLTSFQWQNGAMPAAR